METFALMNRFSCKQYPTKYLILGVKLFIEKTEFMNTRILVLDILYLNALLTVFFYVRVCCKCILCFILKCSLFDQKTEIFEHQFLIFPNTRVWFLYFYLSHFSPITGERETLKRMTLLSHYHGKTPFMNFLQFK